MPTLAFQLADRIYDGGLLATLDSRRTDGAPYELIAREVSDRIGAYVSGETIRRWHRDAEPQAAAG